jgi:hypothetical protein
MANEFDKLLRELFRQPKMALLYQLLHDEIIKVVPLAPKVQQMVTEKEGDTVLEIPMQKENNTFYILNGKAQMTPKWRSEWPPMTFGFIKPTDWMCKALYYMWVTTPSA